MGCKAENDVALPSSGPESCERLWFLAYTRPRLEGVVLQNLERQGFETYLPLYKNLKKTDGVMAAVLEPMFLRYVFFRPAHVTQSIAPVRSTRGVAQVISFGHEVATIRTETLNAIRQLERQRSELDLASLSSLRAGRAVRLLDPAFGGLEGLVKSVSSRRVAILLELMGRQQLVSVDHHQLEVL